jgi:hypothetical protein
MKNGLDSEAAVFWINGFGVDLKADTPEERAVQGAAFLDSKEPDWFHWVDFSTLAMSSPWACVLGQVADHLEGVTDYVRGLEMYDIPHGNQAGYDGFQVQRALGFEGGDYGPLTAFWRREIMIRRRDEVMA